MLSWVTESDLAKETAGSEAEGGGNGRRQRKPWEASAELSILVIENDVACSQSSECFEDLSLYHLL